MLKLMLHIKPNLGANFYLLPEQLKWQLQLKAHYAYIYNAAHDTSHFVSNPSPLTTALDMKLISTITSKIS